jgi:hypothetical protein
MVGLAIDWEETDWEDDSKPLPLSIRAPHIPHESPPRLTREQLERYLRAHAIDVTRLEDPYTNRRDDPDEGDYSKNNAMIACKHNGRLYVFWDITDHDRAVLNDNLAYHPMATVKFSARRDKRFYDERDRQRARLIHIDRLERLFPDYHSSLEIIEAIFESIEVSPCGASLESYLFAQPGDYTRAYAVFGIDSKENSVVAKIQGIEDARLEAAMSEALGASGFTNYAATLQSIEVLDLAANIKEDATRLPVPALLYCNLITQNLGRYIASLYPDETAYKIVALASLHSRSEVVEKILSEQGVGLATRSEPPVRVFPRRLDEIAAEQPDLYKELSELAANGPDTQRIQNLKALAPSLYCVINGDPKKDNWVNGRLVDWNSAVKGPFMLDLGEVLIEAPPGEVEAYLWLYNRVRRAVDKEFAYAGLCQADLVEAYQHFRPALSLRTLSTGHKAGCSAPSYWAVMRNATSL